MNLLHAITLCLHLKKKKTYKFSIVNTYRIVESVRKKLKRGQQKKNECEKN